MNKRLKEPVEDFIFKGENTPLSLGTLVVCALCLLILITATFIQIDITHLWLSKNELGELGLNTINCPYIPQIPAVLFIASILGPRFSFLVVVLYLLIGFFVAPVFALGGGISYLKSGLFGYILGFIFAIIPSAQILQKNRNLKGISLATILTVITIHTCGILYCTILGVLKIVSFNYVISAIQSLSGIKTLYDIIISFIVLLFAIPAKQALWIAMGTSNANQKQKVK